jgi:hypothetical protein
MNQSTLDYHAQQGVPDLGQFKPGSFDRALFGSTTSRPFRKGMELVDLAALGIVPGLRGSAQGFHTAADIVTQTADGRDLNEIWNVLQQVVLAANAPRDSLVGFLSRRVTIPVEDVPVGSTDDFEEASEFGVPHAMRATGGYFSMGYSFKWYDLAARYTWQFLADATTEQVNADANTALEADSRLMLTQVLKTIFNNINLVANIKGTPYNVYKFYNNDGTVPPPYGTNTFTSSHNHFITTAQNTVTLSDGAATSKELRPKDLEWLIQLLTEHGHSLVNGATIVVLANTQQANAIRAFRSTVNGGTGLYDFVASASQPAQLANPATTVVLNNAPPTQIGGQPVIGQYGPALIIEQAYQPVNYLTGFATGGPDSVGNPVAIREHPNAALRGLRLVKGRQQDYPLIDSMWLRGMGTGIRHRGAGAVMQVNTASTTYAIPALYA